MASGLGIHWGCKGDTPKDKVTIRPHLLPQKPPYRIRLALPQPPLLLSMLFPDSFRKGTVKASYDTAQRGPLGQPGRFKSQLCHFLRLPVSPFDL